MKLRRLASRSRIPWGRLGRGRPGEGTAASWTKTGVWSSLSVEPVLLARFGWHGNRQMSQDAARWPWRGMWVLTCTIAVPPFSRLLAKRTRSPGSLHLKKMFVYLLVDLDFWAVARALGILAAQPGTEPAVASVTAWSLNCWTSRQVPVLSGDPLLTQWTISGGESLLASFLVSEMQIANACFMNLLIIKRIKIKTEMPGKKSSLSISNSLLSQLISLL